MFYIKSTGINKKRSKITDCMKIYLSERISVPVLRKPETLQACLFDLTLYCSI